MLYTKIVLSALLAGQAVGLAPSAICASRVSASRVWAAPSTRAAVCLCDAAAAEEPAPVAVASEGAAAEPAAAASPAPASNSKTPLEELEAGVEVEGKIRSVMTYGAFVDIGAVTDGLLHVSEICNEFVKDATEKLTAGDTVQCRIKAINLEKQQLALSCKDPNAAPAGGRRDRKARPDLSEFEGADSKEFVTGKVNSITDFGAFVTLKEGVDGLVHISSIQEGGVGKVSDVLSIGQEVQVRITQVDKSKRRIGLSMLPWSEEGEKRQRRGGGGGGGGSGFFGEADKEFHMTPEELEGLNVGDEFDSPFEAAFARAALVTEAKSSKKKYQSQVL